jgi:pimeloyl-ACP methyl ester carboxylesterase
MTCKPGQAFISTLITERILRTRRLLSFAVVLLLALAVAPSPCLEVSSAKLAKGSPKPEKSAIGESRFATLGGARVHYVDYGKGSKALVLIHGWTQNAEGWRDQISDFTKRNRVIAIDLPGHGQSDKPQVTYSMAHFARAVDAVLRHAKVKRAVLVGHSMGTPIARQFYRLYPEKTLAIVIVDGPLRPFGDKVMMDGMIAGFRGPTYRAAISQMFATMMGPGLSADARKRIMASSLNTPQHVLVSAMEGMADASIWGEDKISVPVLAIMANNPFFGADIEAFYRSLAPNLEFHMWDGVGHFLMMEKPKEFNGVLLAFLDKNKLLKK